MFRWHRDDVKRRGGPRRHRLRRVDLHAIANDERALLACHADNLKRVLARRATSGKDGHDHFVSEVDFGRFPGALVPEPDQVPSPSTARDESVVLIDLAVRTASDRSKCHWDATLRGAGGRSEGYDQSRQDRTAHIEVECVDRASKAVHHLPIASRTTR
jgi:hypothetical protein